MFKFLKKFFRFKSKELEAMLLPNEDCPYTGIGEIEASFYSDKTVSFELSIKHSRIPTGTELEFYASKKKLGTVVSINGSNQNHLKYNSFILDLNAGAKAEIKINNLVMYEGKFRLD